MGGLGDGVDFYLEVMRSEESDISSTGSEKGGVADNDRATRSAGNRGQGDSPLGRDAEPPRRSTPPDNDARLAEIFRRLLMEHHSLAGMKLTIDATVVLTGDEEFDLIWDELDALDPNPLLRLP